MLRGSRNDDFYSYVRYRFSGRLAHPRNYRTLRARARALNVRDSETITLEEAAPGQMSAFPAQPTSASPIAVCCGKHEADIAASTRPPFATWLDLRSGRTSKPKIT